jgi:hypothetical protein
VLVAFTVVADLLGETRFLRKDEFVAMSMTPGKIDERRIVTLVRIGGDR